MIDAIITKSNKLTETIDLGGNQSISMDEWLAESARLIEQNREAYTTLAGL